MDVDPLTELTTLQGLLEAANLPDDTRQAALWCVKQLPGPCREFSRDYDSRHGDEVLRLAKGAAQKVADSSVAATVREQLAELLARLGLGVVDLAPPRPPARRRRKAV